MLSRQVPSMVLPVMCGQQGAEALPSPLDRSIHKAELVDVVFVDHRKNMFGSLRVDFRVHQKVLVRGLHDAETVVWNEALSRLLRLTVVRAERRRVTRGMQSANRVLSGSQL